MKRLAVFLAVAITACARTGLLAPHDAGPQSDVVGEEDAQVVLPAIDASAPDAFATCVEGTTAGGYVITRDNELLRFEPATGFAPIGKITCPSPGYQAPESMAVARDGTVLVYFSAWKLVGNALPTTMYRLNPQTLECTPTAYIGGADDYVGMAFTANDGGATDELFVASVTLSTLFIVDAQTFTRSPIGTIAYQSELAGGGDGRLFVLGASDINADPGSHIDEIDKTSAAVIAEDPIYDLSIGQTFAFMRIGTKFYVFSPDGKGGSIASSWDMATKTLVKRIYTWPGEIVGAGASTCASQ